MLLLLLLDFISAAFAVCYTLALVLFFVPVLM